MTQAVLAIPDSDIAPVTDGGVIDLNTCELGNISEMKFEIEACARGWLVASPRGRSRDFDCIVKRQNTRPVTIQIKRARKKLDHSYLFNTSRGLGKTGRRVLYSQSAFDVLAVHLVDIDKWIFYSREEIGTRQGITYTLPELRKNAPYPGATRARNVDNWSLIDDVAQSLINSGSGTANVPPPVK
jgi:hypothetical protein